MESSYPSVHGFSYQPGQGGFGAPGGGYPPPGGGQDQLADVGPRILAYLIDGVIPGVIFMVGYVLSIIFAVGGSAAGDTGGAVGGIAALLCMLIFGAVAFAFALYNAVFLPVKNNGQTMGKKFMKIRWVKEDGTAITYGDALLRDVIGYMISGFVCYLGFILGLFDARRQTWHDKIFKTLVVKA